MQQIVAMCHITRCCQLSGRLIGLFLLYSLLADLCYARGPHHPRSAIKRRVEQQKHINEHLAVDTQ